MPGTFVAGSRPGQIVSLIGLYSVFFLRKYTVDLPPVCYTRGLQLLPRVYEILVILASKYMGLMGDSRASVRDSALILASVAAPSVLH